MKLWQIENGDEIITLDIDTITILRGYHKKWFRIARSIHEFFNSRTTEVQIYEDAQLINKKEWECLIIPFDESMQLDKITLKSPLQLVLDKIIESLVSSPQYYSILEEWELLKEEEAIINKAVLEKFDLKFELKVFDDIHLKDFIVLSSSYGELTPIEIKTLYLKLLLEKELTKRLLLIIELPEIYAEEQELKEFLNILSQLISKGCNAIIITTSNHITGRNNFIINDQVINEVCIEMLRTKVFNTVPIPMDDGDFIKAKKILMSSVDKVGNKTEFLATSDDIHSSEIIVLYVLLKLIGIEWDIDTSRFPLNIRKFFAEY